MSQVTPCGKYRKPMYWFNKLSKVFQISVKLRWLASTFVLSFVAMILSANMFISLIFACSHI